LLASCRDGCTDTLMITHGFTIAQILELVRAGHSGQYESNGHSM
jgi:hypothetical protein